MHANMPEIDVQYFCPRAMQRRQRPARFTTIDRDRPATHRLLPKPPKLVCTRLAQHGHVIERKLPLPFSPLTKDRRMPRAQRSDLPIDMQHLRLEEGDDVLRSDEPLHRA